MSDDRLKDFEEQLRKGGIIAPKQLHLQVPVKFISNGNYTVNEKMFYLYLWSCGIVKKYGYPGRSKILADTGLSISTQKRLLTRLEELGGVYVIRRFEKGTKKKLTNLYYLADISIDGSFNPSSLEIIRKVYPDKIYFV